MYINEFVGMDFIEGEEGVVLHFLNGEGIAEEYLFSREKEATSFYLSCMYCFEQFEDKPVADQERLFRKFLKKTLSDKNYVMNII